MLFGLQLRSTCKYSFQRNGKHIQNDFFIQLISYKRYLEFTLVQWRLSIYPQCTQVAEGIFLMKSPVFLHIFLVILQNSFHEYQIFANSIRSYSCTLLLPFLTRLRICCTYLIKTFVTFPRYILRKLYRLYQKNVAVCIELVHDWLAGTKK